MLYTHSSTLLSLFFSSVIHMEKYEIVEKPENVILITSSLFFFYVALAMSFFFPHSLTKLDDALTKRILISHDPDDRRIDSEQLLHIIESILISNTSSHSPLSSPSEVECLSEFELIAAQETIGEIISKASHLISCASNKDRDLSARVMALLDLLGHYTWDAKVLLVLASFAMTYGEWWLIIQLCHQSHLAASVSDLRQISNNSLQLQHRFKIIRTLFSILTDMTRSIIRFCTLTTKNNIPLDDEAISLANPQVHAAAYWIIKTTLICSTRVIHFVSAKYELAGAPTAARWELSSLASRLSSLSNSLKQQVETCRQQIERKLRLRLNNLHTEVYVDNQEVLRMLLGLHDEFPLKNFASQAKPKRLSELKNMVILLLVSTPELLPVKKLILLSEKLYQYHHELNDSSYEVVWVPIAKCSSWSEAEKRTFNLLSNSMPWCSIRRPWQLSEAAVEYIKQAWEFRGQLIMPVLDTQGAVVNHDSLNMALVWGAAEAFPFSNSREFQLWKAADWNLEFLLNDLDPLVSSWIEEGRYLCIFGGNDVEWIRKISTKIKHTINSGLQVKAVYVGPKNLNRTVENIFRPSDRKFLPGVSLSATMLEFFWLRLESMIRSKLRAPGANSNDDMIIHQLEKLLDLKCGQEGWAIMGMPKDTIEILQGREVMECLDTTVSSWGKNATSLGLKDTIRADTKGPDRPERPFSPEAGPCNHFKAVAYSEEVVERTVICDHCKRPMEMFFISE